MTELGAALLQPAPAAPTQLATTSVASPSRSKPSKTTPSRSASASSFHRMEDPSPQPERRSEARDILTRNVAILVPNAGAANNTITTSLYTWYTFPTVGVLELLYPWKKFANFYFFLVGLMQMTPASLTRGQPSSWSTLLFIMLCELFFKAREDLERHRGDRDTNSAPVEVLPAAHPDCGFVPTTWASVKVGDVVRVRSRESFPADLLLLRGSDPPGQCWVNTKPLDGETDTKLRLAPKALAALLKDDGACAPAALRRVLQGHVRCEEPNDKVNDITAQLCLDGKPPVLLSEDNFLLRGCQLRNTEWILGLVVSSGTHTKIQFTPAAYAAEQIRTTLQGRLWLGLLSIFGGAGPTQKMSTTARMVNVDIMGVVICLVLICISGGLIYVSLEGPPGSMWYLDEEEGSVDSFGLMAIRYFLICYQFVPISLYVSMMFYQTMCRFFLTREIHAYDASQDEPCQVRQMSLIDELGQVSHIFSDKTGTLTSNQMEFRRCFIFSPSGLSYGCGETAISRSLAEMRAADAPKGGASEPALFETFEGLTPPATHSPPSVASVAPHASTPERHPPVSRLAVSTAPLPHFAGCKESTAQYCNFEEAVGAPSLLTALGTDAEAGHRSRELVLALAVNHSVLLESVAGRIELSASSPDEQAFVAAAEFFGIEYVARDADRGVLTLVDKRDGSKHEVEVLEVFPYESSRKRMSIVVRLPPALVAACGGGEAVRLYTKGADSVLLAEGADSILEPGSLGSDMASRAQLDGLLCEWADIALRTLVFAKRELPNFEEWHAKYRAANEDPEEVRKLKLGEPCEISRLQAEIECGLTLQGATAIEDKLQDGVPEVLADLREAGIKIWMLTGDKVGTAKNIATACNILPGGCDILELTTETHPVLDELKTAELVAVANTLDAARQAEDPSKPAARGSGGVFSSLFSFLPFGGNSSAEAEGAARSAYLQVLKSETERLDALHPDLAMVRAGLEERRELMLKTIASGGRLKQGASFAPNTPLRREPATSEFCMVIDEKAIEYCGLLCSEVLAAVGHGSRSVVACRARKDQKAQLLNLIKHTVTDSCCLAIGDGANDVAMIQAGQIGVGIIGKEGMQAVNNSDFAIGQFRFLRQLLLVHGRYVYRRTALFCYYMFYKNIANVLAMYFYTLVSLASGDRLFTQVYLEVYNIVFTALPIILFCVFDQDVDKAISAQSPRMYTPGMHRVYFTHTKFVRWMGEAVFLGAIAIYLPALALGFPGFSLASPRNGDVGVATISLTAMSCVVVCVNLRLAIEMNSWHFLEHLFMWGSIISIELACVLFSFVYYPSSFPASFDWSSLHAVAQRTWDEPAYWLAVLLVIVLSLAPRILGRASDTIATGRAARRRSRIVIGKQQQVHGRKAQQLTTAQMAIPSSSEMNRYRQSFSGNGSMTTSEEGAGSSADPGPSDQGTYAPAMRRGGKGKVSLSNGGFAFSNDEKSSINVLSSFGRLSLNRRPAELDD